MRKNSAQFRGGEPQLRSPLTWSLPNSASKYVEELGPIKRDAQLSKDQIKRGPLQFIIPLNI